MKSRPSEPLVSIVAPFYNESAVVGHFFDRITKVLAKIGCSKYEIICINDGSSDDTLAKLIEFAKIDPNIVVLDFSRNFGKEAALTAGIDESSGDVVIPIDSDLQDPPELIGLMLEKWSTGHDVVLAERTDRSSDSFLKRITAELFYKVHNKISETPIPENVGDFRLMDRMVVDALKRLPERRRFMKGLFAWVGFNSATIEYSRELRVAGGSKFSGWKLINFAIEGITSFSTAPLRLTTYVGLLVSLLTFMYAMFILFRTLLHGIELPGYASLIVIVLFLGGVQLMSIGVLGEYVGRIYLEIKQRPIYLIQSRYRCKRVF